MLVVVTVPRIGWVGDRSRISCVGIWIGSVEHLLLHSLEFFNLGGDTDDTGDGQGQEQLPYRGNDKYIIVYVCLNIQL